MLKCTFLLWGKNSHRDGWPDWEQPNERQKCLPGWGQHVQRLGLDEASPTFPSWFWTQQPTAVCAQTRSARVGWAGKWLLVQVLVQRGKGVLRHRYIRAGKYVQTVCVQVYIHTHTHTQTNTHKHTHTHTHIQTHTSSLHTSSLPSTDGQVDLGKGPNCSSPHFSSWMALPYPSPASPADQAQTHTKKGGWKRKEKLRRQQNTPCIS